MKTFNDGGPAFPCESNILVNGKQATVPTQGMTLRDYFAAKAMQGFMASADAALTGTINLPNLAYNSYAIADSMLVQRSLTMKTKEPQS